MQKTHGKTLAAVPKGFTLIEILIAIAIVGIVAGAIFGVFLSSNRSYHTQESMADTQQRVRVGLDFLVHDLRLAGMDPLGAGTGFESAAGTNLRLTADLDLDGAIDAVLNQERVTYDYDAGSRTLRRKFYETTPDEEIDWTPLIDNVSALTFTYLDSDGNVTANPADIRMVDIAMTCQGTNAKGQPINRTLTTRVICRNMYM